MSPPAEGPGGALAGDCPFASEIRTTARAKRTTTTLHCTASLLLSRQGRVRRLTATISASRARANCARKYEIIAPACCWTTTVGENGFKLGLNRGLSCVSFTYFLA